MIQPPYNILDKYYGDAPYMSIEEARTEIALFFAFSELGPEEYATLRAELGLWLWQQAELWDFDPPVEGE